MQFTGILNPVYSTGSQPKADITSTASSISLTAGSSFISFQNTGDKFVWIGDADVNAADKVGHVLMPYQMFSIQKANPGFTMYFATAAGETSTISIIEG